MRLQNLTESKELRFMEGEEEIIAQSPTVYDLDKEYRKIVKPTVSIAVAKPIVEGKIYEQTKFRKRFETIDECIEFSKLLDEDILKEGKTVRFTTIPFIHHNHKLLYNDDFINAFVSKDKKEISIDGFKCLLGDKKLYKVLNSDGEEIVNNIYDSLNNLIYSIQEKEDYAFMYKDKTYTDNIFKDKEQDRTTFIHREILSDKLHVKSRTVMGKHDPTSIGIHEKTVSILNDKEYIDFTYMFRANKERQFGMKDSSYKILPGKDLHEKVMRFSAAEHYDDGSIRMELLYI